MSDEVPAFKPWYRWVGAGGALALGIVALAFAVPELLQLIRDLRTLPPVIVTSDLWPAMPPLGLGMLGMALFFLFPPVLVQQRRRARGEPETKGMLLRTKAFLVGIVASLALYPVLTIVAGSITTSTLEDHGYQATPIDHGHRSRIHDVRWSRPG